MNNNIKATVLSCIDYRFQKEIEDFIEIQENCLHNFDHIAIAGGVHDLIRAKDIESEYILSQIDKSVNLHSPKHIYLINHEDCGMYGNNNSITTHEKDLKEAKRILQVKYPDIEIRTFIAKFDKVKEIKWICK